MFLLRVLFYLLRVVLYWCLSIVHFFAKPGSRLIVPVALVLTAFFARDYASAFTWIVLGSVGLIQGWGTDTEINVGIWVLVALLSLVYYLASKLLAVILGAFPLPTRPLFPMRRLRPTATKIKSYPVTVVVPPPPRWRR
jgi:hypothetical protein